MLFIFLLYLIFSLVLMLIFFLRFQCFFFSFFSDEKEEVVLGSLPLLSFKIGPVQASDNISRKFAFKVGDLCAFVLTVLNAVGTRDGRGGR